MSGTEPVVEAQSDMTHLPLAAVFHRHCVTDGVGSRGHPAESILGRGWPVTLTRVPGRFRFAKFT